MSDTFNNPANFEYALYRLNRSKGATHVGAALQSKLDAERLWPVLGTKETRDLIREILREQIPEYIICPVAAET